MAKGRATATFVVEHDVTDNELVITITVPSTSDDAYGVDTVNGSVALGRFVAQTAVQFASVPTKAEANRAEQFDALKAMGKTDTEANDLIAIFG